MDLARFLTQGVQDLYSDYAAEQVPIVLAVGLSDSVHTARWIKMVQGRGVRVVLLPVYAGKVNQEFGKVQFVRKRKDLTEVPENQVCIFDTDSVDKRRLDSAERSVDYQPWRPSWLSNVSLTSPGHLLAAIQSLRPNLIHSMVLQLGGYLSLSCKEYLKAKFPPWLASNWGSDISLFRMLPDHQSRIMRIMSSIDAYHAECQRDVLLAKQMGFAGFTFPALPASGGLNFDEFPKFASFARTSERREILIKGYHGWSGRALHILSALHLTADSLRGYTIRIALASKAVARMSSVLANQDNLKIVLEPYLSDHRDALLRMTRARVVVGLGISDGISTTLLEAMTTGAFPIQSTQSCGNEWFTQNETGIAVSPHDTEALAEAIRRAVTHDSMVDAAALRNRRMVERRWDAGQNGEIARHNYRLIMQYSSSNKVPGAHSHGRSEAS